MIQSSCREASTHSSAALSSRIRPQVAVNREKSIRDRVKRVWDTNGSPFGWRSSRKIYGVGAKAHSENARTCQNQPRSTKHSDCTDQGDRPRRRGHYGSGDGATSADKSYLLTAQILQILQILAGSFSALSKRNFARKYAFDSIFQALQDLHTFAPLQSQHFS